MSFQAVEQSAFSGKQIECFRFVIGETVYRYTSADEDQVLDTGDEDIDGTYTAAHIYCEPVGQSNDVSAIRVNIMVARDNPVAMLYRGIVPDDRATVFVYRKHTSDAEVISWWSGSLKSVGWRNSEAEITTEPVLAKILRLGLRMRWQPICNLVLYSARCGVDPDDFTASKVVNTVVGRTVTFTSIGQSTGYYDGGYVVAPDGSRRFITRHTNNTLELILDFDDLEAGDTVQLVAGCDRTAATCRSKFDNIANMVAFFRTPNRNPFKDGLGGAGGESGFNSLPS